MRFLKKIFIWISISFVFQFAFLFCLNKYVQNGKTTLTIKNLHQEKTAPKKTSINIPGSVKDVHVSENKQYISYYKGREFFVKDTIDEKEQKVQFENNASIIESHWLKDRERIVLINKCLKNSKEMINLSIYDPQSRKIINMSDLCEYKESLNVKCVTETSMICVFYIYISDKSGNDKCFRVDINNDKFDIRLQDAPIKNMKMLTSEDTLIYKSEISDKIYASNPDRIIAQGENLELIDTDNNDKVYIGKTENNKIVEIAGGSLKDKFETWKKIVLDEPADISQIYINKKSEIIVNYSEKSEIQNITTGKQYKYKGEIAGIKNDFYAVLNDNKVKFYQFK